MKEQKKPMSVISGIGGQVAIGYQPKQKHTSTVTMATRSQNNTWEHYDQNQYSVDKTDDNVQTVIPSEYDSVRTVMKQGISHFTSYNHKQETCGYRKKSTVSLHNSNVLQDPMLWHEEPQSEHFQTCVDYSVSSRSHPAYRMADSRSHPVYSPADSRSHPAYSLADSRSHPAYSPADSRSHPAYSQADSRSHPAYSPADSRSHPAYSLADSRSHPAYSPADSWSHPAYSLVDSRSHPAYCPADSRSHPGTYSPSSIYSNIKHSGFTDQSFPTASVHNQGSENQINSRAGHTKGYKRKRTADNSYEERGCDSNNIAALALEKLIYNRIAVSTSLLEKNASHK